MTRIPIRLAGATALLALLALAVPASAQRDDGMAEQPPVRHRSFWRGGYPDRGGGRGDAIYPPPYDAARRYYGGRGDDRWRWVEPGGRPSYYYGYPFLGPFGSYY